MELEQAKQKLIQAVERLQEKKDLAGKVEPDYYEPGRMEDLEQYLGEYRAETGQIRIRTESRGLRYEERTPRLNALSVGDPVRLEREPENPFNGNNIMILTPEGASLGNLPAELCDVIAPLWDGGCLRVLDSRVSYVKRIAERSRYARQGILFVEIRLGLSI